MFVCQQYLGDLQRVSSDGKYLEAGKWYTIPTFQSNSLVLPGEQVPMVVNKHIFNRIEADFIKTGRSVVGLLCPKICQYTLPYDYGVTCEIFEKGERNSINLTIKLRACQRFKTHRNELNFPQKQVGMKMSIQILPEIVLSDSLFGSSNTSLSKYRGGNDKSLQKIRSFESASLPWPQFVYEQYNICGTMNKLREQLTELPSDPVKISFWCAQNLALNPDEKLKVFLTDSVPERMMIIEKSMKYVN